MIVKSRKISNSVRLLNVFNESNKVVYLNIIKRNLGILLDIYKRLNGVVYLRHFFI